MIAGDVSSADGVRVDAAVQRAREWVSAHPAPLDNLGLLADEAWFYQMLLFRGASEPLDVQRRWHAAMQRDLDAAQRLSVDLGPDLARSKQECCDRALSALMLGHLLHVQAPAAPDTLRVIEQVTSSFERHAEYLCSMSFLHNFAYAHNLSKMGRSVPGSLRTKPSYKGLPPQLRAIVEGYYNTHVILFASDTLRVDSLPAQDYAPQLAYILERTPEVLAAKSSDLAAEFSLCLALCGMQGAATELIEDHLLSEQAADGHWADFGGEERVVRHCTFVALLALMERRSWKQRLPQQ